MVVVVVMNLVAVSIDSHNRSNGSCGSSGDVGVVAGGILLATLVVRWSSHKLSCSRSHNAAVQSLNGLPIAVARVQEKRKRESVKQE